MDNKSARRRPRRLLWPAKAAADARPDAARRRAWPRRGPGQEKADGAGAATSERRPLLPVTSPRRRPTGQRRIWLAPGEWPPAAAAARRRADRERRLFRFAAIVSLLVWSMELVRALWTGGRAWM